MKEETILFSLDNAKTPKEKRAAYEYGCDASFLVFRFLSVHIRSELNSGEHSSSCHQQNVSAFLTRIVWCIFVIHFYINFKILEILKTLMLTVAKTRLMRLNNLKAQGNWKWKTAILSP